MCEVSDWDAQCAPSIVYVLEVRGFEHRVRWNLPSSTRPMVMNGNSPVRSLRTLHGHEAPHGRIKRYFVFARRVC